MEGSRILNEGCVKCQRLIPRMEIVEKGPLADDLVPDGWYEWTRKRSDGRPGWKKVLGLDHPYAKQVDAILIPYTISVFLFLGFLLGRWTA